MDTKAGEREMDKNDADIVTNVKESHKKRNAFVVLFLLVLIGSVTMYMYQSYNATHIKTDDAFVDGSMHTVASKVAGTVREVFVADNEAVKQGQPLVALDTADYAVKEREAQAAYEAEQARLAEVQLRVDTTKRQLLELKERLKAAQATVAVHRAGLEQAERDIRRAEGLYQKEAIPRERYEKTLTAHEVKSAEMEVAQRQSSLSEKAIETQQALIRQAETAIETQRLLIKQREAVLSQVKLSMAYTTVYAPVDGYISKKSVVVGNQIQAGQPLMAIVTLEDVWVTANFKETQLSGIRPGQRVEIKVDAYPQEVFSGKVDSIMAGTGSVFSLFPPENATGHYVKVVQRVPVKILVDKAPVQGHILRVGMSVVPTVLVQ
ncbi:HlyD family secretion protein [Candidatus Magnetobacterium casense]|uniref:HlyD family secretion protein n=1 Tax=Candidatus Magnetobacterium casense TaxID=1455061 RepID=A0ABS6RUQ3_9BACT|nr:HlyD family secretion protein [Candidatus Magnetobacterium casensis]MBV6340075.1 HlyD family secretion protein [Candidatus Magnetobacterium casensis]